ncbi:nitroreductase family protein [Streptomyces sp. NPDC047028]|uniref:nitroreductase family protein n=1 Tax=Streptomyces sp. NPDC047028 TaxID=3155793 RepID=UPI0033DE46FD
MGTCKSPEPDASGLGDPNGSDLDADRCAVLLDLDLRSRQLQPTHRTLPAVRTAAPTGQGPSFALPDGSDVPIDAAAALANRTSGSCFGSLGGFPAPDVDLVSIAAPLRHALYPHPSDLVTPGERPPVNCYFAAPAVSGLPDAFYRWCPDEGLLHTQAVGGAYKRLDECYQLTFGIPMWTFSPRHQSANLMFYLAVDRLRAERVFGDRAYRVLHQEAGIVAQRLCTLAAASGLAARIHNGYPAAAVGAVLGLPAGVEPVIQILVGRSRPSRRYQMEVTP